MKNLSCKYRSFSQFHSFIYDSEVPAEIKSEKPVLKPTVEKAPPTPQALKDENDRTVDAGKRKVANINRYLDASEKLISDKYKQNWPKTPEEFQRCKLSDNGGFSSENRYALNKNVWMRKSDTGEKIQTLPRTDFVTIANPVERIPVADKIFIAITDKNTTANRFVAEEYLRLVKIPEQKKETRVTQPTQKQAAQPDVKLQPQAQVRPQAKTEKTPSTPEGWMYDEALGQTRPMTPDEKAGFTADRTINKTPDNKKEKPRDISPQLQTYLANNPLLLEHYVGFKASFLAEITSLQARAKGLPVEHLVNQLVSDFRGNFDQAMFKLFQAIDLKNDPVVIARLLQSSKFPKIVFDGESNYKISDDLTVLAEAHPSVVPPVMVIRKEYRQTSYPEFKAAITHEMTHIVCQDYQRMNEPNSPVYVQRFLHEGVTQMLTERATGRTEGVYESEKKVASEFFRVAPKETMAWYAGAMDTNRFQAILKNRGVAQNTLDGLFNVNAHALKKYAEIEPELEKNDYLKGRTNLIKEPVVKYLSGNFGEERLRAEIIERVGNGGYKINLAIGAIATARDEMGKDIAMAMRKA